MAYALFDGRGDFYAELLQLSPIMGYADCLLLLPFYADCGLVRGGHQLPPTAQSRTGQNTACVTQPARMSPALDSREQNIVNGS